MIKKKVYDFVTKVIIMVSAITLQADAIKESDCKVILNNYYNDISGFGIPKEDEAHIINCGGAPTYGEITPEAVEKLIDYLQPKNTDVFVDAGSGVGKLVTQFFFSTPVKKSIGIELSKQRCEKSVRVKESLSKDNKIPTDRILEFYNQNILDANLDDTTIFFMCSTCFSTELMQQITDKLAKLKPGLRVITLKHLPVHKSFKLIHQMILPMTWSKKTNIFIYELLA